MKETLEVRVAKYLSAEMSVEERTAFEHELLVDENARKQFEAYSRIWNQTVSAPSIAWDTDKAWESFSNKLNVTPVSEHKPRRIWMYRAAAASIVVLLGLFLLFKDGSSTTYTFAEHGDSPIELKDGSKVTLNKDAELTVYGFTSTARRVELIGEAFFNVQPDKSRPFTILCGNTWTEVVGTSFNLKETSTGAQIFVATGKIIFKSVDDGSQSVALTAGEAAIFKNDRMEFISNPSPNIMSWRTNDLRFVRMPLSAVAEDISIYFDQKVIIENEGAKKCIINIPLPFTEPKIETVLQAVSAAINAVLVQQNDTYIIRGGKDCP